MLIQFEFLTTLKLLLLKIKNRTTDVNNFNKDDYDTYIQDKERKSVIHKNYSNFIYTPIQNNPIFDNVQDFMLIIENLSDDVTRLLLQKKTGEDKIYELIKEKKLLEQKYENEIGKYIRKNLEEETYLQSKINDLKNINKTLRDKLLSVTQIKKQSNGVFVCYIPRKLYKIGLNIDKIYNKYLPFFPHYKVRFLYKKLTTLEKLKHIERLLLTLIDKDRKYKIKFGEKYKHAHSELEKSKKEQFLEFLKLKELENKKRVYHQIISQQHKIRILPKHKTNIYQDKVPIKFDSTNKERIKAQNEKQKDYYINQYYKEHLSY